MKRHGSTGGEVRRIQGILEAQSGGVQEASSVSSTSKRSAKEGRLLLLQRLSGR